jgi:hypothetical protein
MLSIQAPRPKLSGQDALGGFRAYTTPISEGASAQQRPASQAWNRKSSAIAVQAAHLEKKDKP